MKKILPALLFTSLVGCNSNPFPDGATSATPNVDRYQVRPALGIDAPDFMRFDEGKLAEYRINVKVPAGNPVVILEDIPAGVSFDTTKGALVWTPSFEQANDPSDYTVKTREYPISLTLRSDVDPVTVIRKTILLQVHDTPRAITVAGLDASYSMKEGEANTLTTITVTADDFAAKDVRAELKDSSLGMKLVRRGSAAEWVLKAEYGIEQLRVGAECRSSGSCVSTLGNTLILTAPDGRQQTQNFTINLQDQRQILRSSLPSELVVKGDMTHAFTLVDGNKEIAPVARLVTAPDVGLFQVRLVGTAGYEAQYEISWSQIPVEAVGVTYPVVLETCSAAYSSVLNTTRCSRQTVQLKVEERAVAMPTIARGDWSQETIKYLQVGKPLSQTVTVSAGRAELRVLSATAASSDARDVVTFAAGRLTVTSENLGLKTVNVTVVNSVGGVANAVFLYEVMPANWGENIILASASSAPEFASIEALWGKSTRAYHAGHNLNARALVFRKTVTAGTHSMLLPDVGTDLSFFAANMKQILITTPLLENLPADIVAELRTKGLRLGGRSSKIPNFSLKDFELEVARDLGIPTQLTTLAGTSTAESAYPYLISLSPTNSVCKALFSIIKAGPVTEQYVVGASCPLSNGRKIVILGFEWADLKLAEADAALLAQWFKKIWE
jgi:hypothetical protein